MKKGITAGLGFFMLAAPLISFADTAALKAQLETMLIKMESLRLQLVGAAAVTLGNPGGGAAVAPGSGACLTLARTLEKGVSGEDVGKLQAYLKTQGYFFGDATGFFGPITEAAVIEWQADAGLVLQGDTANGSGTIGPRSRALLARCGASAVVPAVSGTVTSVTTFNNATACTNVAQPTSSCASGWQRALGINGCTTSWQCASSLGLNSAQSDAPPVINNISGPTSLTAGGTGTYVVGATDQGSGALSYNISWGDESQSAQAQIQQLAQVFNSSNTASHTYTAPGSYTITATAQDSAGNTSVSTFSVTVQAAASSVGTTAGGAGSVSSNFAPGSLIPIGHDSKCPAGTLAIAVGGYCYVPVPTPITPSLCPAGRHITAASGCLPDDPTQPAVVPGCVSGYYMTAANGCVPRQ